MAVSLTPIFASDADEFAANAADIFGAGTLGETKPHISVKWSLDGAGKIASATVTLSITSTTAHWAGAGLSGGKHKPQPDGVNKTAIARIEALNKAHEQKHVDTYQNAFDANKAATEQKLVGKTAAEADAVIADLGQKLRDACEALHKTEGLVTVVHQANGAINVAVGPAGAGGCD